jgi:hypothetical protein
MLRSSTGDQLTSAAIAAVQKWPHWPNRSERTPVEVRKVITLAFRAARRKHQSGKLMTARIRDEFQVQRFSERENHVALERLGCAERSKMTSRPDAP